MPRAASSSTSAPRHGPYSAADVDPDLAANNKKKRADQLRRKTAKKQRECAKTKKLVFYWSETINGFRDYIEIYEDPVTGEETCYESRGGVSGLPRAPRKPKASASTTTTKAANVRSSAATHSDNQQQTSNHSTDDLASAPSRMRSKTVRAKTSTASATAAENTRVTEAAAAQTRAAGKSRIPRLKATFSGAARRSDRLSHRNNIAAKAESVEPDHAIRSNDNEEIEPVFDYRGNEGTAQPYRRSPRAPSVDLVGLMNRMHTSTDSTDTGSDWTQIRSTLSSFDTDDE